MASVEMKKNKITESQCRILSILKDKHPRPVQLFECAGYNKFPAINALLRKGLIQKLTQEGHWSLFSLTNEGLDV